LLIVEQSGSNSTRKVALITGASSGFGLLTAIALAQDGFDVVATMRSLDKQETLLDQANKAGVGKRLTVMEFDVTVPGQAERVVAATLRLKGRLDVLVNNAGYAVMGVIEEIPLEDWRAQFETNFFGAVATAKAALPHMRERRRGAIINVSSGAGIIGFPNTGPYAASKFALEGFSEALRLELLGFGVAVALVEPGTYNTGIAAKHVFRHQPDSPYAKMIKRFDDFNRKSEQHAPDPQQVADTIRRICRSRRPKLRYVCGSDARMIGWMKRLLPWRLVEWILRKALHV
jgi:NAD(P)-dependent dehydrogenase (short-subunit alcohol dehydrogenase family)